MKQNLVIYLLVFISFNLYGQVLLITTNGDSILSEIVDESNNHYIIEILKNTKERKTIAKTLIASLEKLDDIDYIESNSNFVGANKIIVHNNLNFEDNFSNVGRLLINRGFNLKEKEREFGFIVTESAQTSNSSLVGGQLEYFIKANIKEKIIELNCYGAYASLEKAIGSYERSKGDFFLLGEGVYGKGKAISEPWKKLKEIAYELNGNYIKYARTKN